MIATTDFDAIVVGSGMTGGWAAKELTEKGLKVLMIERGRMVKHREDYTTEFLAAWQLPYRGLGDPQVNERDYPIQHGRGFMNEWNQHFFVSDRENPYQTPEERPFIWVRGYQLGGRSLLWGRQCYRWSDFDFEANKRDGNGVDWPIRYADLAPWYDHVEQFAGISGSLEGLPQLPDGKFQRPMELNHVEKAFKAKIEQSFPGRKVIIGRTANMTEGKPAEGRSRCQYRNICSRGCSYGAYFSTLSSTLPAAQKTGNLTILVDSRVTNIDYNPKTRRVIGVRVVNVKTKEQTAYSSRIVFLCASAFNSVGILLQSANESFPNGLANSSGVLGTHLMDHVMGRVSAKIPNYEDRSYYGSRPNIFYIPRFRNITENKPEVLRGYGIQGGASRSSWRRGLRPPGIGAKFKASLRQRGEWHMALTSFAECLPRLGNRLTLDKSNVDPDGCPQLNIDLTWGDNERKLFADALDECERMLRTFGGRIVSRTVEPLDPGAAIHEMGGARMGHDPKTSVLNRFNQAHDVSNLFVTDGACMSSSACQNPSLTYMAITARACDSAVSMLKENKL